jgi:hypothetical protein
VASGFGSPPANKVVYFTVASSSVHMGRPRSSKHVNRSMEVMSLPARFDRLRHTPRCQRLGEEPRCRGRRNSLGFDLFGSRANFNGCDKAVPLLVSPNCDILSDGRQRQERAKTLARNACRECLQDVQGRTGRVASTKGCCSWFALACSIAACRPIRQCAAARLEHDGGRGGLSSELRMFVPKTFFGGRE